MTTLFIFLLGALFGSTCCAALYLFAEGPVVLGPSLDFGPRDRNGVARWQAFINLGCGFGRTEFPSAQMREARPHLFRIFTAWRFGIFEFRRFHTQEEQPEVKAALDAHLANVRGIFNRPPGVPS